MPAPSSTFAVTVTLPLVKPEMSSVALQVPSFCTVALPVTGAFMPSLMLMATPLPIASLLVPETITLLSSSALITLSIVNGASIARLGAELSRVLFVVSAAVVSLLAKSVTVTLTLAVLPFTLPLRTV